jgi:Na+-driven multidrug efflux pump
MRGGHNGAEQAHAAHPAGALLARPPARAVLALGLPLAAASLFQAGFNLSEVWIFGQVGDGGASLSGAAISDLLTAIFALLAHGMANAAVAQVSRATGARDEARAGAAARAVLAVGLALSLGSALVGLLADPLGAVFMAPAARAPGTAFLRIMALGGFGTVFMVIAIGVLRGRGEARGPLILVAVVSLATLGLEAVFLLGLFGLERHGLAAAAWITVLLRAITALAGVALMARSLPLRPAVGTPWLDRGVLREQLALGLLSALQQSVRVLGMLALVGLSMALLSPEEGDLAFRALTLWTKVDIPMIMLALALGGSAAPVVGAHLGAGQPARAGLAAAAGLRYAFLGGALNFALVLAFGPALLAAFVPDAPPVREAAWALLLHIAPCYPFMAAGIACGAALNGAGDMRRPLAFDAFTLLGVQAGLAAALMASGGVGGLHVALAVSGVLQGLIPMRVLALARAAWQRGPPQDGVPPGPTTPASGQG